MNITWITKPERAKVVRKDTPDPDIRIKKVRKSKNDEGCTAYSIRFSMRVSDWIMGSQKAFVTMGLDTDTDHLIMMITDEPTPASYIANRYKNGTRYFCMPMTNINSEILTDRCGDYCIRKIMDEKSLYRLIPYHPEITEQAQTDKEDDA